MEINIGLRFFNEETGKKIQTYADLCGAQSPYLVGQHSLPHVTLLQIDASDGEIFELMHLTKGLPPIEVFFDGMSVSEASGYFWLALRAVRSEKLQTLHHKLLVSLSGKHFRNKVGEFYDPHLTLGAFKELETLLRYPPPLEWMRPWSALMSLKVGLSGAQGQYVKDLPFSSPLEASL